MKYAFNVREVQSLLNGFLCIFKPRDVSISALEKLLLRRICEQANCLDPCRPLPTVELPIVESHSKSGALVVVGKRTQVDYSKHPLMVGQMFRPEEMRIEVLNFLEPSCSGVCLFGLNDGCDDLETIRDRAWLNEYFLEGELGRETVEHHIRGKVAARAEFDHVTLHKLKCVLSMIRMQFKKTSLKFANVDMQSQEAFELARRGVPRPKVLGSPLIYGIELRHYKLPNFKLSVQVTGEQCPFMRKLIHEIGCCLHTTACPRRVRRVREGCFGLDHALLDKHFHLESIVKNLLMSTKMVNASLAQDNTDVIQVKSESQIEEERQMVDKFRLRDEWTEALVDDEEEDSLRLPWGRDYTFVN
uniref:Pseudouridine synthase II N-terminal domain-containing protein n=1 Tax=Globodera rostochiensis TaxID=31243 RepID=A0A914HDZ7_GLORO